MKSLSLLPILLLVATDTVSTQECNDEDDVGAIRLTCPRNSNNEGAVQMCHRFRNQHNTDYTISWVYLSTEGWDNTAAEVVCRQLGNPYAGAMETKTRLPNFRNRVNQSVSCNGSESNIRDCFGQTSFGQPILVNAKVLEVAAVVCKCKDGEIRLVDGLTQREGRLERCVNGRWGTVCREGWENNDTNRVCGRLGFSTEGAELISVGDGTGQIHTLRCSTRSCTPTPAPPQCHHGMDVGVKCLTVQEVNCPTVSSSSVPGDIESSTSDVTDRTTAANCLTEETDCSAANITAMTALGAVIALLVLVVLIMVVGWILTCVLLIRKQSTKTMKIANLTSPSNRRQMDNPTYNGTTGPREQPQYSSLGPAYEFIADTNSTPHDYDVINRQFPHPQATPTGSHDPSAEHDYHVLEHSKGSSQSNPQDYETPMATDN